MDDDTVTGDAVPARFQESMSASSLHRIAESLSLREPVSWRVVYFALRRAATRILDLEERIANAKKALEETS